MKFGLLGRTLGHSYSPQIHHALGNTAYTLYEREPQDLVDFFGDPDLQGINITIPYKTAALDASDIVDPVAERIGCVNTMVRRDGFWYGYNTDYDGFCYALAQANITIEGKHCLILGDGATSQTVATALTDLGATSITKLSRKQEPTYDDISDFYDTTNVIVNTTPVGMYPDCPKSLISLAPFTHLTGVMDVIYNPHRTSLLLEAEQLGIPHTDGLPMLVAQAVYAAQHFQNKTFPATEIATICQSIRQTLENIILIGMPGSGKTSIGEAVAAKLQRPFVDIDEELTKKIGDISTFITTQGEMAFREIESRVLAEFGKQAGLVISTGGGAVTQPQNYALCRQNGRLYHIERPLEELDTTGRVLSQGGISRLQQLYEDRLPLYTAWRQVRVENTTVEAAAQVICDDIQKGR